MKQNAAKLLCETQPGVAFFFVVVVVPELNDHSESSDFGRPQYRCSDASLLVRFSLIRHSDLRLEGEFASSACCSSLFNMS